MHVNELAAKKIMKKKEKRQGLASEQTKLAQMKQKATPPPEIKYLQEHVYGGGFSQTKKSPRKAMSLKASKSDLDTSSKERSPDIGQRIIINHSFAHSAAILKKDLSDSLEISLIKYPKQVDLKPLYNSKRNCLAPVATPIHETDSGVHKTKTPKGEEHIQFQDLSPTLEECDANPLNKKIEEEVDFVRDQDEVIDIGQLLQATNIENITLDEDAELRRLLEEKKKVETQLQQENERITKEMDRIIHERRVKQERPRTQVKNEEPDIFMEDRPYNNIQQTNSLSQEEVVDRRQTTK